MQNLTVGLARMIPEKGLVLSAAFRYFEIGSYLGYSQH